MLQIAQGDLVAVQAEGRYYYALILDQVRLFGGNWVFVFHTSSQQLLSTEKIISGKKDGFHAFVDFIWAKREGRITRLARKMETKAFQGPGFLKITHSLKEKATLWFIYDMDFKELKRISHLTPEEAKYPEYSRIDDTLMVLRVNQKWTPDQDPQI